MKHVCPYCESVHMDVTYLSLKLSGQVFEIPGFRCPQCNAEFLLSQEVKNFLNSQSAKMLEKSTELR